MIYLSIRDILLGIVCGGIAWFYFFAIGFFNYTDTPTISFAYAVMVGLGAGIGFMVGRFTHSSVMQFALSFCLPFALWSFMMLGLLKENGFEPLVLSAANAALAFAITDRWSAREKKEAVASG